MQLVKKLERVARVSDERSAEREDPWLSLSQISQRFGVSRTTVHNLRTRGEFPPPRNRPGSTRPFWRESEVAAYFAAHPKRQGARNDLRDHPGARDMGKPPPE
ncbi:helix-turn-helix transcriptional regulator [Streptomyces sp. CA-253872]|uniref:helix-turn-helix transcriptional regulator n=1 Tax=Streptomyces sp. CA-253872 TaxID=3240067 RepID=UPI003D8E59DB